MIVDLPAECFILTGLDFGSWADEMDEMPLPGKSRTYNLHSHDDHITDRLRTDSWYVFPSPTQPNRMITSIGVPGSKR